MLKHKKTKLVRMELIFSYPIIGRFGFSTLVRVFEFLLSDWSTLLLIEVGVTKSDTERCSGSPGHSFSFKKLFI